MTTINTLPGLYGIYKFHDLSAALDRVRVLELGTKGFWALSHSPTETSLICIEGKVETQYADRQESWIGMYFDGQLDFALVGVLSRLTSVLANAGLGVLAISTFDTDYVFVPSSKFSLASQAIEANGYTLVSD
jgi:hypothetical protein